MPQERLVRQHRVLIVAKARQCLVQKAALLAHRFLMRHSEMEMVEVADMVGKATRNQRQHILRHRVRPEPDGLRHQQVAPRRWLAIFRIIIPFATLRIARARHQQSGFASHVAIEKLHPQLLARRRPTVEFRMGTEEAVILMDRDRQPETQFPIFQHRAHPPFTCLRHVNGGGVMPRDSARDLGNEAAAIGRIVQFHIIDRPPQRAQPIGMVAHGGQDEGDLRLVMADIAGLIRHLHHQHDAARLVGVPQCGDVGRQLVAQHRNEKGAVGHAS